MATHFSILAWEIPWTEKPDRLQSMGSQSFSDMTKVIGHTHIHVPSGSFSMSFIPSASIC